MFETFKFGYHAGMQLNFFNRARKAKKDGNDQRAILFLKGGIRYGYNALCIQSPKISEEQRAYVKSNILFAQNLYQQEMIEQIPITVRAS